MSDVELSEAEEKVLRAIYLGAGKEAGESHLNDDDLEVVTGLTCDQIKAATARLIEVGFITKT